MAGSSENSSGGHCAGQIYVDFVAGKLVRNGCLRRLRKRERERHMSEGVRRHGFDE